MHPQVRQLVREIPRTDLAAHVLDGMSPFDRLTLALSCRDPTRQDEESLGLRLSLTNLGRLLAPPFRNEEETDDEENGNWWGAKERHIAYVIACGTSLQRDDQNDGQETNSKPNQDGRDSVHFAQTSQIREED